MTTITDNKQYQKPSFKRRIGGIIAGTVTMSGVALALGEKGIAKPYYKYFTKMAKVPNLEDFRLNQDTFADIISEAKLPSNIIALDDLSNQALVDIKSLKKEIRAKYPIDRTNIKTFFRSLSQRSKQLRQHIRTAKVKNAIIEGKNAILRRKPNGFAVSINSKLLPLSVFHEVGHAMNYTKGDFLNTLQKNRGYLRKWQWILPMIAFATIDKTPNKKDNELTKSLQFIKQHIGIFTGTIAVPIIIEELRASHNGNKIAKKLCTPKVAKQVAKSNLLAGVTYIYSAIALGIATHLGNKVSNYITKPKEIKNN